MHRLALILGSLLTLVGCAPRYEMRGEVVVAPHTTPMVSPNGERWLRTELLLPPGTDPSLTRCERLARDMGVVIRQSPSERVLQLWYRDPDIRVGPNYGLELQTQLRNLASPENCFLDDYVLTFARRFFPVPLDNRKTAIELVPGMRVRIERSGGTPGMSSITMLGAGSVTFEVVGDDRGVFFHSFGRVVNVAPVIAANGSGVREGTVSVDLVPDNASTSPNLPVKAYRGWRLLLPEKLPAPFTQPSKEDATKQIVFVGSDSIEDLDRLSVATGLTRISKLTELCSNAAVARCVAFPGRAYAVPEIAVMIRGHREYVPVGTTLGDLIAGSIDVTNVTRTELTAHVAKTLQLQRRYGTRLVDVKLRFDNDGSWRRLGLLHGDEIQW